MSQPETADPLDTVAFEAILEDLREAYTERAGHTRPWIIGFSGGKDSTLLLHLVLEMLLRLPPSRRTRSLCVVCNDTLVESPVVQAHVDGCLARVHDAAETLGLPLTVKKTVPEVGQTFWVNLIGRGYRAPTRAFRWCTDRLKIRPTGSYLQTLTEARGGSVLLLGVRRAESSARRASVDRHTAADGGRYNPHGTVPGCVVYRPIADLSTEAVWAWLLQNRPPWGGTHRGLITLYRNAQGGECPFVVDHDDAPSCGESPSSRFGCYVCTVVDKDRSLENLVAAGFEHLEPLVDLRDWLVTLSADPTKRLGERRDGSEGLGPFSFETRAELLARVRAVEVETGLTLLSPEEEAQIRTIWRDDQTRMALRGLNDLLDVAGLEPVSLQIAGQTTTGRRGPKLPLVGRPHD